jgi:hypothetical protein
MSPPRKRGSSAMPLDSCLRRNDEQWAENDTQVPLFPLPVLNPGTGLAARWRFWYDAAREAGPA